MSRLVKIFLLFLGLVFFVFPLPKSYAAENSFYLSPSQKNLAVGEEVEVHFYISADQPINAASVQMIFSSDLLTLKGISVNGSIFNTWAEFPEARGERIMFTGGLPDPGWQGNQGLVLSLVFQADQLGRADISFISGSLHANDGQGTNILTAMSGSIFTIADEKKQSEGADNILPKPRVFSQEFSGQEKWQKINTGNLYWEVPENIEKVFIDLDHNPIFTPTTLWDKNKNEYLIENLSSGQWYFHIMFAQGNIFSSVENFPIFIDNIPPEPFLIKVHENQPQLVFEAKDLQSGIDFYELSQPGLPPERLSEPSYPLNRLSTSSQSVTVVAFDKAGNSQSSYIGIDLNTWLPSSPAWKIFLPAPSAYSLFWLYYILVGLLLLFLIWFIFWRYRNRQQEKAEMSRQVGELSASVDYGFATLRKDIMSQIEEMWAKHKKGQLSYEEMKKLKRLEVDLDIVEMYVKKELNDIEEINRKK